MKRGRTKAYYHLALITVLLAAANYALIGLSDINLMAQIVNELNVPEFVIAPVVGVSALLVAWQNWTD
jgi:uncharacterized membrane protein YuzA (DUF378 family)